MTCNASFTLDILFVFSNFRTPGFSDQLSAGLRMNSIWPAGGALDTWIGTLDLSWASTPCARPRSKHNPAAAWELYNRVSCLSDRSQINYFYVWYRFKTHTLFYQEKNFSLWKIGWRHLPMLKCLIESPELSDPMNPWLICDGSDITNTS